MGDFMAELEAIIDDATGANEHNMLRVRPYEGQPHTDTGERGKTEIRGITFRDLRDCFVRAVCMSSGHVAPDLYEESLKGERACLCDNDLFRIDLNQVDIVAVQQNLCCEVERLMGIFPNVPPLTTNSDED